MADYENLTEEQIAWIRNLIYNENKYSKDADEDSFVVPFISMNNGYTPAEIRAESAGLYKDVQRVPFIRRTGIISKDNTIKDIDITSLVYYGTLEQSKIAPTLENIDVKLYIREPKLKKVITGESEEYADSYIWREIQPGFHVYNNDTVYGYEWLVLQDDYVNTDGLYNLHMNIEDGLGLCKFAGTQAPINLAGVQYKIIITAKNLWSREYSLLENVPVLHTMYADNDDLAPTVNAIKEYYSALVDTAKAVADYLEAGSGGLVVNRDGTVKITKTFTLEDIENVHDYINTIKTNSDEHINSIITNGVKITSTTPHGISNNGVKGNLNAAKLAGAVVSNGAQAVTSDLDTNSYIPYVNSTNQIGLGTSFKYYERSSGTTPSPLFQETYSKSGTVLKFERTSLNKDLTSFLNILNVGSFALNTRITKDSNNVNVNLTSGSTSVDNVNLETNKITTTTIDFGGNTYLNADIVAININNSSSIAYKEPISELLGIKVKTKYPTLTPNTSKDADGNIVDILDTTKLEEDNLLVESAESGFEKLGSALQALYELPLATFKYKRGQDEYKDQIGIFVERVNQIRDHLKDLKGSGEDTNGYPTADNLLVRKRNTLIKSDNSAVKNYDQGLLDIDSERSKLNAYTYTDEEVKSIAHYLDLTTSKKELAQELRNTVGILLKAAKEAQERLLNVETAVYGWDAETVPGTDDAKTKFLNSHIAKDLQESLNNNPLLLGLNRLVRAICLELYDTTDLETIDAETNSRLADSDTLGSKATVKSRMDQIDEIMDLIISQQSAMLQFYKENIENDESRHTYTNMVWDSPDKSKNGIVITSDSDSVTELSSLVNKASDSHKINTNTTVTKDQGGQWSNLPDESDLKVANIDSTAFGNIASTYNKHSPTSSEVGVVRIPTIETPTKSESVDGSTVNRDWQTLKLNGTKDVVTDDKSIAGTYRPYFTSKLVAWDSAKLQRVSNKLSEVTHALYGVDDVIQSKPNRLEVVRRNVTNLIDDLYPNRAFRVEVPRNVQHSSKIDIYEPFKTSNVQNVHGTITTKVKDEKTKTDHTSIIHWLDNELFNFSVTNHYVGNNFKSDISTIQASKKATTTTTNVDIVNTNTGKSETRQVTHFNNGSINFNTSKLITDESVSNLNENLRTTYDTYKNAYSKLDLLSAIIGIEDCFIGDLFGSDTLAIDGLSYLDVKDTVAIGYNAQNSIAILVERINLSQSIINGYKTYIAKYETDLANCNTLQNTLSDRKNTSETALTQANTERSTLLSRQTQNNADITTCENLINTAKNYLTTVNDTIATLDSKLDYDRQKLGSTNTTYYDKSSGSNQATINTQITEAKNNIDSTNSQILYYASEVSRKQTLQQSLYKIGDVSDKVRELAVNISNPLQTPPANVKNFICINTEDDFVMANATFEVSRETTTFNYFKDLSTFTRKILKFNYTTPDGYSGLWEGYCDDGSTTYVEKDHGDRKVTYNGSIGIGTNSLQSIVGTCSRAASASNINQYNITKIKSYQTGAIALHLNTGICTIEGTDPLYALGKNPYKVTVCNVSASTNGNYYVGNNIPYSGLYIMDSSTLDAGYWDTEATIKYHDLHSWSYGSCGKEGGGALFWAYTNSDDYRETNDIDGWYTINNNSYYIKDDQQNYDTIDGRTSTPNLMALLEHLRTTLGDVSTTSDVAAIQALQAQLGKGDDVNTNTLYGIYNTLLRRKTALEQEISDLENQINDWIYNQYDSGSTTMNSQTGQKQLMALREVHEEHLNQLKTSKDEIASQLANVNTQITNLQETIDAMTASIANIDTQKEYIQDRIKDTESALSDEQKRYDILAATKVDIENKTSDKDPLPYYQDELAYIEFLKSSEKDPYPEKLISTIDKGNYKIVKRQPSDDLLFSTNVSYLLSRKQKPLQARITTLEAFADALTEAYNFKNRTTINKIDLSSSESALTNIRFEELQNFTSTIKYNLKLNEIIRLKNIPKIFDLDLSEDFNSGDIKTHNRLVWQRILFASDIRKTNYTDSYYTISIVDPIIRVDDCNIFFPFNNNIRYDNGSIKFSISKYYTFNDITVKYVDSIPADINNWDVNTIYLKKKVTTSINWQAGSPSTANPVVKGKTIEPTTIKTSGFQNQTEYNIYKTISDIANSFLNRDVTNTKGLYYQMMLAAHPIGSVYLSNNSTDPSKLFGGTWEARQGYLLASNSSIGNNTETLSVTKQGDKTVNTKLNVNSTVTKNNLALNVTDSSIKITQPVGTGNVTVSKPELKATTITIPDVVTTSKTTGFYYKGSDQCYKEAPTKSEGKPAITEGYYYNIKVKNDSCILNIPAYSGESLAKNTINVETTYTAAIEKTTYTAASTSEYAWTASPSPSKETITLTITYTVTETFSETGASYSVIGLSTSKSTTSEDVTLEIASINKQGNFSANDYRCNTSVYPVTVDTETKEYFITPTIPSASTTLASNTVSFDNQSVSLSSQRVYAWIRTA